MSEPQVLRRVSTGVHEEGLMESLHWKQGDNSRFSFFKQSGYCPSTNFNVSGSEDEESACNAADLGSITGLGRSPGTGNGYPLQYSCLENPMDRGAWQATVYGLQNCPGAKDLVQDPVLNVLLTVGLSSLRLRMTSLSLKVTKAIHTIS